jgi:uncharacterized protein (UPF0332 family)
VTPFDFADFLDLADDLATGSDEAAWRSAISRAYYAILHVAYRTLRLPAQATISHRTTHRATWDFYTTSSVAICRQVGHAGIQLRQARVDADYVAHSAVSSTEVTRLLTLARLTMERLRRHGYRP